mmetsp:Transcript_47516/g.111123  ORF Transcript_47516/g.111123 Transcript_47516/m.111123 type:complete len:449 (+) Transcript_47516:49-1395(+)
MSSLRKHAKSVDDAAGYLRLLLGDPYFRVMGQYLLHSGLVNLLSWVKFGITLVILGICLVVPLLWPVAGYWFYHKVNVYKESCKKLLPEWLEDARLDVRIQKAIDRYEPKEGGHFTSRDGLKLKYYVEGTGQKHVLICNGVNCSYILWRPLFDSLSSVLGKDWREEFKVVTWDYRGLYKSEAPSKTADFSVRSLCEDAYDLREHLQKNEGWSLEKWHAVCGWSTGVQASLEYAGLFPDTVERLFLVNGSHGHTLNAAFQPMPQLFFFALMGRVLQCAIFLVRFRVCASNAEFERFKTLWVAINELLAPTVFRLRSLLFGSASLEYMMVSNSLDLTAHGPEHCGNVMRILQALESHSSAYTLPELKVPALVVCGLLDAMTPAFTQYEIAGLAPRVRLVPMAAGTHHCILEVPDLASPEIAKFFMTDTEALDAKWASRGQIMWPKGWYLL